MREEVGGNAVGDADSSLWSGLSRSRSVREACAAVVDHIAAQPGLLPSLYLARGGRLRCQAARGYWQVLDGIPAGTGVIGSTYATGRLQHLTDPGESPVYLEAAEDVCEEICVPVCLDGRTIGALNVESQRPLDANVRPALERYAELLADRIDELGGIPAESRSQRLARHAASLVALQDPDRIHQAVLEAALDVAEMDSAMLALGGPGRLSVRATRGEHAAGLAALPVEALEDIASWVRSMTSVYTVGGPGTGFPGHERLRACGAGAVIVLPLAGTDTGNGILVLIDAASTAPETDDIELLELLAAQATSCLTTAAVVGELHERAARDPLTGLGHHGSFQRDLAAACERRAGSPPALLVIDIDGFKAVNDADGHLAGDDLLCRVAAALEDALRGGDRPYRIGGDEFAVLARVTDAEQALALAGRLRAATRTAGGPTISIGVALHQDGESDTELFARADSALYRVKRDSRDGIALG